MVDDSTTGRRRDERLEVMWPATLLVDDSSYRCRIGNVSLAGTLVHFEKAPALAMEAEVMLSIPELGEFAAEVAWLGDNSLGLAIIAGPDLLLKKFAEASGAAPSEMPTRPPDDQF